MDMINKLFLDLKSSELTPYFLLVSVNILVLYYMFYFWLDILSEKFRNINPAHKKIYVVKNFVKSLYLADICLKIPAILTQLYNRNLDLIFVKKLSIAYFLNDFIALLIVPKLPTTTVLHHIFSSTLGFYTLTKTTNTIDIQMLALMYGCFSCMSYIVNFFLAYRVIYNNNFSGKILAFLSLIIYISTTALNWLVQVYLLYDSFKFTFGFLGYFVFLYMVMRDDIILMKWLYDYVFKN